MLTLEQQAAFVEEAPEIFLSIPGGCGKMGHTHIRLAEASEDVLTGARSPKIDRKCERLCLLKTLSSDFPFGCNVVTIGPRWLERQSWISLECPDSKGLRVG